ncbi:MAG TPA: DNA/RNA non-specific endonuclease [Vicinamibacteria bacterium]|nr:DNA/RNA non-specific endonuclease [Vicinamibacteria bacterium]
MSSSFRQLPARARRVLAATAVLLAILPSGASRADSTPQTLPFSQDWTNTGLITTDDNWSGVPGVVGFRGDGLAGTTGVNPQSIVVESTVVDVNANQLNPNTFTTGGVSEFHIANPVVALQGSGTARAPYLQFHINTTGMTAIHVAYSLRDIDGSTDNAVQPVALQFRVGASGNFTNVPEGFVADASTGPSLATAVTPVSVTLPTTAENQPLVQIRVITTDAVGSDEWIGIDDIAITGTAVSITNPSGAGSASPSTVFPGQASLLTVSVTPGANPASTGIQVSADLSSIGGSPTQAFANNGGNSFSFNATVAPGTTTGAKSLAVTITDAEGRSGSTTISLQVDPPPPPLGHPVISQIYGGGGNSGATYRNDYVELYNPGTAAVDVTGWTVQYASATGGFSASLSQPLAGVIGPGEYYLVALGSGGSVGADLPPANVSGADINMSATAGKVALVSNADPVSAASCPLVDADLIDFVGYGSTANCREGSANAPGPPSGNNVTAILRKNGGSTDTDQNGNDFVTGSPNPRRTAPIAEVGPRVQSTDPGTNGLNAPRDSSITVTFSEPVDVADDWLHLTCITTGTHDDATHAGGPTTYVVTPNANFLPGETCTVTIFKDLVHDQDLDDAGPNTDTLPADYTWTFTVATGAAPPYPPEVHLTMGNPSAATPDVNTPNNYLMEKPEFALSYNRDRGTPNWVSWHLDDSWTGNLVRNDTFRPDPAVPPDWYRVQATDFFSTGFDRGHMTPNADRDDENSIPINQATFLMSNMVPQAPNNNQGSWAKLENHLRTLLPASEVYIVSGPAGMGGTGSNGGLTTTLANGHVRVPAFTWKVALVLPKAPGDDVARVSASTRTIAVIMPNTQIPETSDPNDWQAYLTTVDAVEALTGYDFFASVEDAVEHSIEAGVNGVNPPGTADQLVTAEEDSSQSFTLNAVSMNPSSLTYAILSGPSHGAVTGSDGGRTYVPAPDFAGTDSFTYRVSDSIGTSNTATVTIHVLDVNDAPVAVSDTKTADEDSPLVFAAADLTANDSAGPADEASQILTVASVAAGAHTHGAVGLAGGQVTYVPESDFNGSASFTYQVCDDGFSAGVSDPKCATGTVNVEVAPRNDPPVLTSVPSAATTPELAPYTFVAQASDVDSPSLTFSLLGAPAGAAIDPVTGQFSWTPTEAQGGLGAPYAFKVRVSDGLAATDADVLITVTEVNQSPVLIVGTSQTVSLGDTLTFVAVGSDADVPAQTLTYGLSGAVPAGATIDPATGVFTWTPTAAQSGATYAFNVSVTDGVASTSVAVAVSVTAPLGMERDVLDRIKLLRQGVTDRGDGRILDDIIEDLSEAVQSPYWVDASHLDPRKGDKVFDEDAQAVRELVRLKREGHSAIPDALLQGFIDLLVKATRLLAETAIGEAVAAGGDPGDIAKANADLAEGNQDAALGRPEKAIKDYGAAWRRALGAVK